MTRTPRATGRTGPRPDRGIGLGLGLGRNPEPRIGLGPDHERGSGTVLTVAMVAVVVVLAGTLGVLVRVQVARNGAQTAADLAALAAAGSIAAPPGVVLVTADSGPAAVCGLAGRVALRNGSALVRCTVLPRGVVQVTTSRPAGIAAATATARAGPRAGSG